MAITWNETVQVSEAGQHWMEHRSTVYALLIDFLGNRPSFSLIADWSRDSRMKRVAEQYEAAGKIMNYLADDRLKNYGGFIRLKALLMICSFSNSNRVKRRSLIMLTRDALRTWPSATQPKGSPSTNFKEKRMIISRLNWNL